MEFVLVVKRYDLFDLSFPHGFHSLVKSQERVGGYLDRIRSRSFFMERRAAEGDSSFKQIIPYCLVSDGGDNILMVERLSTQTEKRLHAKLSVGIGGHINPVDDEGDRLLLGCRRELEEELHLPSRFEVGPAGVLNDDSQDVGSVHFGVVFHVVVPGGGVDIREKDKARGRLVPRKELLELHSRERPRFETWSALLLDRLDEVLDAELTCR